MTIPEIVQKKNEKFPEVIRRFLDTLDEPSRRAIVIILNENGEMSFKKLLMTLRPMNPSTLTSHLRDLMEAGLVDNHYKKSRSEDEYSFYEITELGADFLKLIGVSK